jgi:hypothetical protein
MELYIIIGIAIWCILGLIAFISLIQTVEYSVWEKVVLFLGSIMTGPILFIFVFFMMIARS